MKIRDISEPASFFKAVNTCAGRVELMTAEGDCLNLKSRLCQYIALTQMFEDKRVEGIELVLSEPCDLNKLLGKQRARQGGKQRILVLVHGVCGDGLGQELIGELVAQVEHLTIQNAQVEGLLLLGIQAGLLLAHIAADANDIEILLVLEPLDTYGCIKATRICENDFFLAHGCFLSPLVAS